MTPKITCPSCQEELPFVAENLPDGGYTETCPGCFTVFSYRIRKGVYEPYPPKVNQNWKGKGEAGGKNDN